MRPSTGVQVTLTYAGATAIATGVVAQPTSGTFVAQVDTTGEPGPWEAWWDTTGNGQGVVATPIIVLPAPS